MTEQLQIYKCNICGNIVEIINPGQGAMTCCSLPMELLKEQSNDEQAQEKHVPIVTIEGENKIIRVGTIEHPMEKQHYIVFIEAISPDKKYVKRKYLYPGEKPQMELKQSCNYDNFTARELCNIHGLWKSEYNSEQL